MFIADTHSDTLYALGIHHAAIDRLMISPRPAEVQPVDLLFHLPPSL